MKKILLIITALLTVITLSACASDEGNSYTDISNQELSALLEDSPDYQYVDVRTLAEYNEAHIVGFDINIDYYQFKDDYSMLDELDKTIPVVLVCRSGNRSGIAADILIDEGFMTVYNLENGISDWDGETE